VFTSTNQENAMGMSQDKISRLEKSFSEQIINIYMNAARFHWDANKVNEAVITVWTDSVYESLPRYAKSFVEGVCWKCDRDHWKLVVFSYEINGKRMAIDEERYQKVSPREVHEKWGDTGKYIYRDNKEKIWC